MDATTIIDTFNYPANNADAFKTRIGQMKVLAQAYNLNDKPVKLFFFGDQQSGIRFRIDTADPHTKGTVEKVLRQFLVQHNLTVN